MGHRGVRAAARDDDPGAAIGDWRLRLPRPANRLHDLRGLKKAEGQFWKLALSPPSQSNRTDKGRLLAVLGISESEYVARFTSPAQTDWVMRCTPRKVLRTAEQEPVVLPPAKRAA
jgi:hypothetical protein